MNIRVSPSCLNGSVHMISSKSDVHRLMICSAIADSPTRINNVSLCDDILATVSCIEALGARVEFENRDCIIYPASSVCEAAPVFDCNESGSTLRFMLPVAAAVLDKAHFKGSGRLPSRPIGELVSAMQANGVDFSSPMLPLDISGRLNQGEYILPGNISSQYISGLLMALSVTEGESKLTLSSPLQSASYVSMTLSTLKAFGAQISQTENGYLIKGRKKLLSPGIAVSDGDWSNAAFFLASGAINGEVTVLGLDHNSPQGDKKITDALQKFGARVTIKDGAVTVSKGKLSACTINLSDTPDMLPILAVAAAFSEGSTRFTGAERLKLKESDRLKSVAEMIISLGGKAAVHDDGITVFGTKTLVGGTVNSSNDHRIVMAAAVAACHAEGDVIINGAEAVNKSYPTFFEDYKALGGVSYVI